MGLALVAVFLYAGSMSTSEIVAAQDDLWFGLILLPSFVIYVIAMVGETNRAPFDLPEAEGELVGGFHTEYSSMKFALFFLAEYINMATVSALATTLFLGGWHAPFGIDAGLGRRQRGLLAGAVVLRQGAGLHLHLHLAARHAAPAALRPVHGVRLEAADPDLAALDRRGRARSGRSRIEGGIDRRQLPAASASASWPVLFLLLFFVGRGRRAGGRGRSSPVGASPSRRWLSRAGDAGRGGARRRGAADVRSARTCPRDRARGCGAPRRPS